MFSVQLYLFLATKEYNYSNVARWVRGARIDWPSTSQILISVHVNRNQHVLVDVDLRTAKVVMLDSRQRSRWNRAEVLANATGRPECERYIHIGHQAQGLKLGTSLRTASGFTAERRIVWCIRLWFCSMHSSQREAPFRPVRHCVDVKTPWSRYYRRHSTSAALKATTQ